MDEQPLPPPLNTALALSSAQTELLKSAWEKMRAYKGSDRAERAAFFAALTTDPMVLEQLLRLQEEDNNRAARRIQELEQQLADLQRQQR